MAAMRQYLVVWRLPGAPLLLVVGIIARLGIGMTPLALLFLVRDATGGRYGPAAVAGGIYALVGAAINPIGGRLSDRFGPTPVLLVTAVAHPIGLLALLWVAAGGSLPAIYAAAAFAGGTFPPLSSAIRSAWSTMTEPGSGLHHLRGTALAAETSLFEIVFIAGPLLVGGFVAFASPAAALVAAAAVTFAGTIVVARGAVLRAQRPHPSHVRTRGLGPLRVPGFGALMVCMGGMGVAFGAAAVAVPGYASSTASSDPEALAGLLLAVWAVGSAIGGFWYGTRRPTAPLPRQFAWLLTALALSLTVLAVMPSPLALGVALTLGGATIAPAVTVEMSIVGRITPASMLNEAYTWVVTMSVAASSVGGAVAGVLVDRPGGVPWAFVYCGLSVGVSALVAAWPGGSLSRSVAAHSGEIHEVEHGDAGHPVGGEVGQGGVRRLEAVAGHGQPGPDLGREPEELDTIGPRVRRDAA